MKKRTFGTKFELQDLMKDGDDIFDEATSGWVHNIVEVSTAVVRSQSPRAHVMKHVVHEVALQQREAFVWQAGLKVSEREGVVVTCTRGWIRNLA